MLETRSVCPTCGSAESAELLEVAYSDPGVMDFLCAYYCHADPEAIRSRVQGGKLSIVECSGCELVYQRNIPNEDFMRELYEDWILEGDHLAPDAKPMPLEHFTYLATEVMHLLAEQRLVVGPQRRLRVLDFGMGWGAWLEVARSFGAVVYGAELSKPKVEYARSIGIPVISLEQIEKMQFDLICTEQVFEHVPYPTHVLSALVKSLAPGGYLKISVPPGQSIKPVLKTWDWRNAFARQNELMPVHPLEHINCFTRRSLDAFAAQYGLEPVKLSALRAIALSTGWHSVKSAFKNVLRPIYRFGLMRGTYAVYRRRANNIA
jgi:2-polyprenyl-3-methyl-5-hydroxy-6-metoxy-1,4-benzoquinol methylase